MGGFYILRLNETSWAELGLTQAETVSLELKLKLSLFDLTDPPPLR